MKKQVVNEVIARLSRLYPNPKPELEYTTEFELLIAVILSAQCTDKRVNLVTKDLFKNYNTPSKMLSLSQEQLEKIIKSCGLYRTKAKNILSCCKDLVEKFGEKVPQNRKDLQSLKGVGRKTANVVLSVLFGENVIAVDTHVFRVSRRIGLSKGTNPLAVEKDLTYAIDSEKLGEVHHYLIFHGRRVCTAKKPNCAECALFDVCEKNL